MDMKKFDQYRRGRFVQRLEADYGIIKQRIRKGKIDSYFLIGLRCNVSGFNNFKSADLASNPMLKHFSNGEIEL
jgi:hypothetical protein